MSFAAMWDLGNNLDLCVWEFIRVEPNPIPCSTGIRLGLALKLVEELIGPLLELLSCLKIGQGEQYAGKQYFLPEFVPGQPNLTNQARSVGLHLHSALQVHTKEVNPTVEIYLL